MHSSRNWVVTICTVAICTLVLIGNAAIVGADDADQGRALYLRYCASCHGANGEGNGPVAPALTTPPTNLRLLSDLYGKPLQEDKVARAIDGRAGIEAHGPREMPVWGERFSYDNQGRREKEVKELLRKLVAYLQSIQTGRTASLK